jgi:hypothetical protein
LPPPFLAQEVSNAKALNRIFMVNVSSKATSKATGTAIPYANITLVDQDGGTIKVLQGADGNGIFNVPTNAVPYWDDVFVQVSAVGYKTASFLPEDIPATISMDEDVKSIGGVVVKATVKPTKKVNYVLPVVLGTAGLVSMAVFFMTKPV